MEKVYNLFKNFFNSKRGFYLYIKNTLYLKTPDSEIYCFDSAKNAYKFLHSAMRGIERQEQFNYLTNLSKETYYIMENF